MKLVMSAGSLYTLELEKIFELARDTGFDAMEVIINYDFQYQDNVALLNDLGQILPVASLHAPFFQLDGWGNKIDQLKRTANLAMECDIPLINFHPPAWMAFEFKFWRWLKRVADFQEEIGKNQVIITMENMPCGGAFKTNPYYLGQTQKMINFLQEHNLFLTFDTAHMGTSKANFLVDFHLFYDSGTMRNMMLVSLAAYIAAYYAFFPIFGNHGLWLAISLFLGLRGLTLLATCRRRTNETFGSSAGS